MAVGGWGAVSNGNDGSGAFTVEGTIEGVVEKAVATVTVEYRDRIADLKELVAGFDLNKGTMNALTVKLNNAERFISRGQVKQAGNMLEAFVNQVNGFRNGKLIEAQADELIFAAKETIRNLNG